MISFDREESDQMGDNNNNLISLSTYRGKRKKLHSKDSRKAASDENFLFTEGEEQPDDKASKDLSEKQPAKIYYMDNYIKVRKTKAVEQVQKDIFVHQKARNNGKILFFADYRKKQQKDNKASEKTEPLHGSNLISLEDYRNKKQKRLSSVKQTLSYGAVVLTLLLSFSVFFPEKNNFTDRSLASASNAEQKELDWNQKIKEMDFTKQQFFIGKKPSSSEYKGF